MKRVLVKSGFTLAEQLPTSSTEVSILKRDVRCKSCGYNLRTLSTDGICPECATAVAVSLRNTPFNDAPARWMLLVACGLGLLLVSALPQIVAEIFLVRSDFEVLWLQTTAAGPKLWIMIRMLQMGVPTAANVAASLGLALHLLAVIGLSWPVVNQTAAMRRMGIGLRVLVIVGMIYWLALAVWLGRGKTNVNDIKSPALAWVTVLDVAGVVLSGWIIAGIAGRGGYRRAAKAIVVMTLVQAAGLALLFGGIYVTKGVENVLLASLLLHAGGGSGLTIMSIWLMCVLMVAARRGRAAVLQNDEENQRGLK